VWFSFSEVSVFIMGKDLHYPSAQLFTAPFMGGFCALN